MQRSPDFTAPRLFDDPDAALDQVRRIYQHSVDFLRKALPLIYGAALLTTLAALVEGFWSAQALPSDVKYAVGILGWILCTVYLLRAGKGAGDET